MDYYDLGSYSRRVTTRSPEAQLWFDRGLVWTYGYNHEEAVRCFERALAADPGCAMAHWGIAYAVGPNYNMPWDLFDEPGRAAALARARAATEAALTLAGGVTPAEAALIEALPARYPQADAPADLAVWAGWNDTFAAAMRAAHRANPNDAEITTIFVEALMNRTPWKMWDLKTGGPAPGADTEEARKVLEDALARLPGAMHHPGLLHLYVHLMEMSPFPERALKAADRLRELVPDAGHLVHMPTHIDILCGHYSDVLHWNLKAIAADQKYLEREGALNIYSGYRVHDYHFAVYGAMFLGQYAPALAAAEELIATTPEELLRIQSPPMADYFESYIAVKQHVFIRFGRWSEILAQPLPEDADLYRNLTATMRYARGIAHAAEGRVAEAEAEQAAFHTALTRVPPTRLLHNNRCIDLLAVAEKMLAGEIAYRKGDFETAFADLRGAVAREDGLPYDEPWGWMQPSRHALGALLLEQARLEEAEAVYRADLGLDPTLSRACQHPQNVWSLHGLHECLARRGEEVERRHIRQQLDRAAARADVPVRASCYCSRAAAA